ncbi:Rne/Rng family ribonuclease [Deltaproteobacteria bacterium TL4]
MTNSKILINVENDETRIATVEDGVLENLHIEHTDSAQTVGNIYRGVVVKIHTAFQAAFINYGANRHGFLPVSDVNLQLYKSARSTRSRPPIERLLKPGQIILVQVVKDEIAHKGATLTTNISLPGRFLVFMPNCNKGGVSKKIEDVEQRTRLKHLLEGLGGEDASAIIRTAGVDRSLSELKRDFIMLRKKWNAIQLTFTSGKNIGLIYREEDPVVRMLRDYYTDDIEEICIDDPEAFQRSLEFFKANIPNKQKRLSLYMGERSLFAAQEIEDQIEKLSSNCVLLSSGGSIVIDPTEALVAIDVNSGKSNQERSIEETAKRTNLEAAEEIARQLRLRNLGGLIVIDFIDMEQEGNRDAVVKMLEDSLRRDKAKSSVAPISQFGLLEMSRQRISSSLSSSWKAVCPTCSGTGSIPSSLSMANGILRQLREVVVDGYVQEVRVKVALEIASYLLNNKRKQISDLEFEFDVRIFLIPDTGLKIGEPLKLEIVRMPREEPEVEEIPQERTAPKEKPQEKKSHHPHKPRHDIEQKEVLSITDLDEEEPLPVEEEEELELVEAVTETAPEMLMESPSAEEKPVESKKERHLPVRKEHKPQAKSASTPQTPTPQAQAPKTSTVPTAPLFPSSVLLFSSVHQEETKRELTEKERRAALLLEKIGSPVKKEPIMFRSAHRGDEFREQLRKDEASKEQPLDQPGISTAQTAAPETRQEQNQAIGAPLDTSNTGNTVVVENGDGAKAADVVETSEKAQENDETPELSQKENIPVEGMKHKPRRTPYPKKKGAKESTASENMPEQKAMVTAAKEQASENTGEAADADKTAEKKPQTAAKTTNSRKKQPPKKGESLQEKEVIQEGPKHKTSTRTKKATSATSKEASSETKTTKKRTPPPPKTTSPKPAAGTQATTDEVKAEI